MRIFVGLNILTITAQMLPLTRVTPGGQSKVERKVKLWHWDSGSVIILIRIAMKSLLLNEKSLKASQQSKGTTYGGASGNAL
jgi:hypothetical protein